MTTTQAIKRFDATLPMSSYELVQQAAELSGMTVRSFVAMATFERAVKLLRSTAEVRQPTVVLSPEESDKLDYLLQNSEHFFGSSFAKYRELAQKVRIVEDK